MRHSFFYIMAWNNTFAQKDNTKNLDQLKHDALRDANVGQGQDIDDSFLAQWLNPGIRQEQEFGQQVALQQMQNEWNSEGEKMKRMVDAGINPNLAAAGVAGSGSAPSVGSPNSSVGSGAAGVGAASQGLQAVAGAADVAGQNLERFSLLDIEQGRRMAETENLLAGALHNKWLARSIMTMLPEQKRNMRADTYLKIANYQNAKEEFHNITLEHDKKKAEIDQIQKNAKLAELQGNLVEAQKLLVEAQTSGVELDNWFKNANKEWREKWSYDYNAPVDVALMQSMTAGNDDAADAIGESVYKFHNQSQAGIKDADVAAAFDEEYNKTAGAAQVAPYLAYVEGLKQEMILAYKALYDNPSDIKGFFAKMFNILGSYGEYYHKISAKTKNNPLDNVEQPAKK